MRNDLHVDGYARLKRYTAGIPILNVSGSRVKPYKKALQLDELLDLAVRFDTKAENTAVHYPKQLCSYPRVWSEICSSVAGKSAISAKVLIYFVPRTNPELDAFRWSYSKALYLWKAQIHKRPIVKAAQWPKETSSCSSTDKENAEVF